MTKLMLIAALAVAVCVPAARAEEPAVTIVEHITAIEGNTIEQPKALEELLKPSATPEAEEDTTKDGAEAEKAPTPGKSNKMVGYRVQVYSDGNQRTAKAEVARKAAAVSARFPAMRTYTAYKAPYWRLRVGDFRTKAEADAAAAQLRSAFPAFRAEIRVVRDRINVRD